MESIAKRQFDDIINLTIPIIPVSEKTGRIMTLRKSILFQKELLFPADLSSHGYTQSPFADRNLIIRIPLHYYTNYKKNNSKTLVKFQSSHDKP